MFSLGALYFINFEIFLIISSLDKSYFKSKLGATILVKIEFCESNSFSFKKLLFFFIIEAPYIKLEEKITDITKNVVT